MDKILYIDTSDKDKAMVSLQVGKNKKTRSVKRKLSSQIVLYLVDKMLRESKLNISEIDEIKVFRGPGSFTGLRVGISVANAISASLGIKTNGKKQIVDAKYK